MSAESASELGVLFDVLRANEAVGAMLRTALKDAGLTPTGYAVLSLVTALERTTPSEIAERIGAKPSTLTAHLASLVEADLISRRRGSDGRSVDLAITTQGRRVHAEAHRAVDACWQQASRDLDVPRLRELLGQLIAVLGEASTNPLR